MQPRSIGAISFANGFLFEGLQSRVDALDIIWNLSARGVEYNVLNYIAEAGFLEFFVEMLQSPLKEDVTLKILGALHNIALGSECAVLMTSPQLGLLQQLVTFIRNN